MKHYLILLLSLIGLKSYSQTNVEAAQKHSQYRINLTITPQLYCNGINVENDNIKPNGISTRNTGGYTTGIEFERRSKSGFLLSFGVQYALQHHGLSMGYDSLGFFDKGVAKILDTLGPQIQHYSGKSSYLKFRIMAGYVFPFTISHGCHLEAKAGLSITRSLTGFYDDYYRGVQFERDNNIYDAEIAYGNFGLGGSSSFPSWGKNIECNIALKKELQTKYLKDISIGLELSKAIIFPSKDYFNGYFDARTLNSPQMYNPIISTDKYVSKDFAIGLRVCAGLWYK